MYMCVCVGERERKSGRENGREREKGRSREEEGGEERGGEGRGDMTDLAREGEQVITVGRLDGTLIHVQDDHIICWHLMDILSAQEQKDRIKSARGKCESSPKYLFLLPTRTSIF